MSPIVNERNTIYLSRIAKKPYSRFMSELTNAYTKEISALKLKKYRQSHRKFVVEGPNLIQEALHQELYPVESIIGTKALFDDIKGKIPPNIALFEVNERQLKKVSSLKTPYMGVGVLKFNEQRHKIHESLLFYMDGIQDPGNLGTIIRSADWFGMSHLLLGEGTVDPYNPKCIQASMGSIFRVGLSNIGKDDLIDLSDKYQWIAADMNGEAVHDLSLEPNTIIVIGNEGQGISAHTERFITKRLCIPSSSKNRADSLNAGISASIIMYELSIKKAGT